MLNEEGNLELRRSLRYDQWRRQDLMRGVHENKRK